MNRKVLLSKLYQITLILKNKTLLKLNLFNKTFKQVQVNKNLQKQLIFN